jgi:hypothetical protein
MVLALLQHDGTDFLKTTEALVLADNGRMLIVPGDRVWPEDGVHAVLCYRGHLQAEIKHRYGRVPRSHADLMGRYQPILDELNDVAYQAAGRDPGRVDVPGRRAPRCLPELDEVARRKSEALRAYMAAPYGPVLDAEALEMSECDLRAQLRRPLWPSRLIDPSGAALPGLAEIVWVILGVAGGRVVLPIADAYVKALGRKLGEHSAALLGLPTRTTASGAAPVMVELLPDLSDDALLALLDLDLTSPELQDAVLRWDADSARWQPERRGPLSRRAQLLIMTAVAGVNLSAFTRALSESVGKDLGERAAGAVARLARRRREPAAEPVPPPAVTLRVSPFAVSPEALRELGRLDLTDPQIDGAILRWDPSLTTWQPIHAAPPTAEPDLPYGPI